MNEEDELEPRQVLLEFIRERGVCTFQDLIELDKKRQLGFRGVLGNVFREEGVREHVVVDYYQGTVTFVPS